MITCYSKPAGDITQESSLLDAEAEERFKKQQRLVATLKQFPMRQRCVCCGEPLKGPQFEHHGASFVECSHCGHIQTAHHPPPSYPHNVSHGISFSEVYPQLGHDEYCDKRDRIYKPKLDWVFSTLSALEYSETELCTKRWLEIGSGAGYFLSAARQRGVQTIIGLEADEQLAKISQGQNPDVPTHQWEGGFDKALDDFDAEVYCSFFVLEHVPDLIPVWESLRRKPVGTLFVFSVPVFGFSCLLEQAFPNQFARNLEGVFHTQIFTESSIRYSTKLAGCQLLGEWIFGQDVLDLTRVLVSATNGSLRDTRIYAEFTADLKKSQDALQGVLDVNRLADQRHILAIRI